MADLHIAPGTWVPEAACQFQAVRASGPGGQNVNKVATKVQLRIAVSAIVGLPPEARERLRGLAGARWVDGDILVISASESRSQFGNKRLALEKAASLIGKALVSPRARRATKPTRASSERRLSAKVLHSRLKQSRRSDLRED